MRRRRFISSASAAVAAASVAAGWPSWLRRAFAADPECPPDKTRPARRWLEIVSAAYRKAQAAGKPLLLLVVPADTRERFSRGGAFGEMLNHGSDETLAALALAEVACAPMTTIAALVPSVERREPLAVLVETDTTPGTGARAIKLAHGQRLPDDVAGKWSESADADARVEARIAIMSKALRDALAPDGMTIERRARRQEARLSPLVMVRARAQLRDGDGTSADLDAAGAVVYGLALRAPSTERRRLVTLLADSARLRLRARRIPGSRWATSSGCATEYEREEGDPQEGHGYAIACGMGFVPEKSRRFLAFLTADGKLQEGLD